MRDKDGLLVMVPRSFTPYSVTVGSRGEILQLPVGPVGAVGYRSFLFDHTLGDRSQIFVAQLPRPLGLVLEEDRTTRRVIVGAVVPGSHADRRSRVARLTQGALTPEPGDVLRACTAVTLLYRDGAALAFGAVRDGVRRRRPGVAQRHERPVPRPCG